MIFCLFIKEVVLLHPAIKTYELYNPSSASFNLIPQRVLNGDAMDVYIKQRPREIPRGFFRICNTTIIATPCIIICAFSGRPGWLWKKS